MGNTIERITDIFNLTQIKDRTGANYFKVREAFMFENGKNVSEEDAVKVLALIDEAREKAKQILFQGKSL